MWCFSVLPDQFTLSMFFSAIAELELIDFGMKVHGLLSKLNLVEENSAVESSLVYMYAKFGLMGNAYKVTAYVAADMGEDVTLSKNVFKILLFNGFRSPNDKHPKANSGFEICGCISVVKDAHKPLKRFHLTLVTAPNRCFANKVIHNNIGSKRWYLSEHNRICGVADPSSSSNDLHSDTMLAYSGWSWFKILIADDESISISKEVMWCSFATSRPTLSANSSAIVEVVWGTWSVSFPDFSEGSIVDSIVFYYGELVRELGVHTAGSELSIRGTVLDSSIIVGVPDTDRHASDALPDDIGDFEGDCSKVPNAIVVDMFNNDINGLVSHKPLDNTPKAIKMEDLCVNRKTHSVSLTYSPPIA
ncbi:hypothetical protein BC332_16178 [Capsicum chinense]|nr:hypothetical protein BC332_16178 [Capsicum chinense]